MKAMPATPTAIKKGITNALSPLLRGGTVTIVTQPGKATVGVNPTYGTPDNYLAALNTLPWNIDLHTVTGPTMTTIHITAAHQNT